MHVAHQPPHGGGSDGPVLRTPRQRVHLRKEEERMYKPILVWKYPRRRRRNFAIGKRNDHSVNGVNGVNGVGDDKCDNDVNVVTVSAFR